MLIDVTIGEETYDELHVDGGVVLQFFGAGLFHAKMIEESDMKNTLHIVLILFVSGCASMRPGAFNDLTDDTPEDTTVTEVVHDLHPDGRTAVLLSAFFGWGSCS